MRSGDSSPQSKASAAVQDEGRRSAAPAFVLRPIIRVVVYLLLWEGLKRHVPQGDTFRYLDPKGRVIIDETELQRFTSLGIPPAWEDVWICPKLNGHMQATGRDAKGRKQYRYHPRWRATRDETKYGRVLAFGRALPQIRRRVAHDLRRRSHSREKVLATVVRLLETTLIRVGNREYARSNKSYGLTTLRDKHVIVDDASLTFQFRGKSGKHHTITLNDRRLARIVKRCRDLPGYELFQYIDECGQQQTIGSADVNDYLREITGHEFTAKDFRTWAGTVLAAMVLRELAPHGSTIEAKRNVVRAIERVAERLGNTPSICRKCYIHPVVLDVYVDGSLVETLQRRAEDLRDVEGDLDSDEAMVLGFLQERLAEV
jgi:DNA topoisomerase-1